MAKKTTQPKVSIIVGVDQDGGFSKNGKIPWTCPDDLKRFKQITSDNICIMGRRTYLDMVDMMKKRNVDVDKLEHILPNRQSFVLSNTAEFKAIGATVVPNIRSAWQSLDEKDTRNVFILGGERVFIEALAFADTIYMNIIKNKYGCDKFFPINIINKNYVIQSGEETDELYQVLYKKRPKIAFKWR